VELEVDKFQLHMEVEFTNYFTEAEKGLEAVGEKFVKRPWNEMGDVKEALKKALREKQRAKLDDANKHYEQVKNLWRSKDVDHIAFSPDLMFRAKCRLISGKMPSDASGEKKPDKLERDSDACIVESLKFHFERHPVEDIAILCFCSENVSDFGRKSEKDGKRYLDANVREGLPNAPYFTNLKDLMAFVTSPTKVKEPTPEEEKKDIEKELQEEHARQVEALREVESMKYRFGGMPDSIRSSTLRSARLVGLPRLSK
jgi:hypothetical protein